MFRLCLSTGLSRSLSLSAVMMAARAKSSETGAAAGGEASKNGEEAAKATPASGEAVQSVEKQPHKYQFRPEEMLNAMRSGDIGKMQATATELVQHKWKEEYTLPAACAVVFIILWYWVAWTRRSVRRKCAATEELVRQQAKETVDMVRTLTDKWGKEVAKSNGQMQAIIEKNSALTADIDRMTAALRSCSIRPTPNGNGSFSRMRQAEEAKATSAQAAGEPAMPEPTAASANDGKSEA